MYASVITVKINPEMIDEAADALQGILTGVSPTGWQHTYLVVDRQTGQLMSFGVWNTEADAIAYETSGRFRQDIQKMNGFLESAPERTTGEIVARIQR